MARNWTQVQRRAEALAAERKAAEPTKPSTDWTMFGGTPSRNMVNRAAKNVPTEWSAEEGQQKNIKWVADLGSKAYGGPVIAGGKVFIGTNNENPRDPKIKGDKGILMCFTEADGKFLWQAVHDKLEAGRVNDWPREGICSTPTVEGNRVYYVSNRAEIICADVEGLKEGKNEGVQDEQYKDPGNADIVWRLDMIKELNVFPHNLATSCPLIAGDILYVSTSNGVDEGHLNIPSPKAPSFLAVDKKTGKVIWQDNSPGEKIMHGQWSNATYAEVAGTPQVLFPGGDGILYSFEPKTGKLLWKFDCNPHGSKYLLGGKGTRSDFLATPVVYENKVYVGVGQDPEHDEGVGHLWCIDIEKALRFGPANKDHDVSPPDDNNYDPAAKVNEKSALSWHFGGPGDANKIGRNYYFGRTMSTVAAHDGLVYAAELAGYLHCLDAKTGKKYWDLSMNAATWSSPMYMDGKIYMGNDDGAVFILGAGKEKKEVGQVNMDGKIRATPVWANGVLYVMTENKLYAIAGK